MSGQKWMENTKRTQICWRPFLMESLSSITTSPILWIKEITPRTSYLDSPCHPMQFCPLKWISLPQPPAGKWWHRHCRGGRRVKTAKLQLMHTPGRKNSPQMRENITWDARTTAQSAHAAHSLTHAATCFMSSGSPFKHLDISYKNITI